MKWLVYVKNIKELNKIMWLKSTQFGVFNKPVIYYCKDIGIKTISAFADILFLK